MTKDAVYHRRPLAGIAQQPHDAAAKAGWNVGLFARSEDKPQGPRARDIGIRRGPGPGDAQL